MIQFLLSIQPRLLNKNIVRLYGFCFSQKNCCMTDDRSEEKEEFDSVLHGLKLSNA